MKLQAWRSLGGLWMALVAAGAGAAELAGTVTDTAGTALAGAQLSLRNTTLGKTTTVYTDAAGAWRLPVDEAGDYTLRARRLGYNEVTETAIRIGAADTLARAIALKPVDKSTWVHELPASDWFARVRFASPELRAQFAVQCAMCHQQGGSTTRLPRSTADWHKLFDMMGEYGATMTQELYDDAPRALNAAYDFARLDLAEFPDDPVARYDTGVTITEWEVGHETAFLHDMAVGPGGTIYSVDWINDKLYALDPASNAVREWAVPTGDLAPGGILGILAERGRRYTHHTPTVAPHSLQLGPDGAMWITLSVGRGLARFDPASGSFQTFDHPDRVKYPHTLRFDRQGDAWYTVSMTNHLVRFGLRDHAFTVYDLPVRNTAQWIVARAMGPIIWASNALGYKPQAVVADPEINPVPYGIDITPDGKVWFSQFNNRRIGSLDPASGTIEMVDTPFVGPRRMRADSRGRLWIPAYDAGKFYLYDPADGLFREYSVPTGSGDMVYALAVDRRDDTVWLCGTNSDTVMHFDPATERFRTYQLPSRVSFTREIEVDADGNVWTSTSNMPFYQVEGMRGKIVRLSFPQPAVAAATGGAP